MDTTSAFGLRALHKRSGFAGRTPAALVRISRSPGPKLGVVGFSSRSEAANQVGSQRHSDLTVLLLCGKKRPPRTRCALWKLSCFRITD